MNQQQSKILEKVIIAKIEEKKSSLALEQQTTLDAIRKENKPKAEKIAKELKEFYAKIEKLGKGLKNLGFEYNERTERLDDYDDNYGDNNWIEIKKASQNRQKITKDLDRLQLRLTAQVYGGTTDFDKMINEIDKELNNF